MPEITIPELTEDQERLVAMAFRDKQREKYLARKEEVAEKERRLFLITFQGGAYGVALPDENGHAIYHGCLYAWVEFDKGSIDFYGGWIDVIANNSAKLFKIPIRMKVFGTVLAMAEVSPDLLHA